MSLSRFSKLLIHFGPVGTGELAEYGEWITHLPSITRFIVGKCPKHSEIVPIAHYLGVFVQVGPRTQDEGCEVDTELLP
jgi:hypothetical protein